MTRPLSNLLLCAIHHNKGQLHFQAVEMDYVQHWSTMFGVDLKCHESQRNGLQHRLALLNPSNNISADPYMTY